MQYHAADADEGCVTAADRFWDIDVAFAAMGGDGALKLGEAGNEADLARLVHRRGGEAVAKWAGAHGYTLLHAACGSYAPLDLPPPSVHSMGENPTLCALPPLCQDGIAVIKFTQSQEKCHAVFF